MHEIRARRIRREVSLILFPGKYSPMSFVKYISFCYSIQRIISWKGHVEKYWFRGNELKRYFRSRRQTRLLSSRISFRKL